MSSGCGLEWYILPDKEQHSALHDLLNWKIKTTTNTIAKRIRTNAAANNQIIVKKIKKRKETTKKKQKEKFELAINSAFKKQNTNKPFLCYSFRRVDLIYSYVEFTINTAILELTHIGNNNSCNDNLFLVMKSNKSKG